MNLQRSEYHYSQGSPEVAPGMDYGLDTLICDEDGKVIVRGSVVRPNGRYQEQHMAGNALARSAKTPPMPNDKK